MSFATPIIGFLVSRAIRRTSVLYAAAALIGACGFCGAVHAAPTASGSMTFASVDLGKVYAGSKIKRDNDATLQTMGAKYDGSLKRLQQDVMLPASDLTTLAGLMVKDPQTDADTKQIQTFEAKAKADGDELTHLQQEPDGKLTDDDKAKLASLSSEYQAGQQALQTVQTAFQDKMQQENDDLNGIAAGQIHAMIAKIAQKQNISVVFSSQVAVYAAIDITEQVAAEMAK